MANEATLRLHSIITSRQPNISTLSSLDEASIERLIHAGADINCIHEQQTAVTRSLIEHRHDVARYFISRRDLVVDALNQFDRTALSLAAIDGVYDITSDLMALGARVDAVDINGVSALGACVWRDYPDIARLLLKCGADVNLSDKNGVSPLHRACSCTNLEAVEALLEDARCDVDAATNSDHYYPGYTPLMFVVPTHSLQVASVGKTTKFVEIVERLLRSGADINAQNSRGETALFMCADAGTSYMSLYIACVLLQNNANIDIRNHAGMSPLDIAVESGHFDIARYILTYNHLQLRLANVNNDTSVLPRDLQFLSYVTDPCRQTSSNIRYKSRDVQSSLRNICRLSIRKVLASRIPDKVTSLQLPEVLKSYLCFGDVYSGGLYIHQTLRVYADITDGKHIPLSYLRTAHLQTSVHGKQALGTAVCSRDMRNVKMIIATMCDRRSISGLDASGQSALHYAAALNDCDITQLLLNESGHCDVLNSLKQTPFLKAVESRSHDVAKLLLSHGCDVNAVDTNLQGVLHYIARNADNVFLMDATFRAYLPFMIVNSQTAEGETALHIAVRGKFTRDNLLEGFPKLQRDTFLDNIRQLDCCETCRLLIDLGVDPHITNYADCTPQQWATNRKLHDAITQKIRELGL